MHRLYTRGVGHDRTWLASLARLVASAALGGAPAMAGGGAGGGGVPADDAWQWAVIGDPGNRDTVESDYFNPFGLPVTPIGGVNYRYRMATTEVTIGQYIEFVQAYYPFYVQNTGAVSGGSDYTGEGIDIGLKGVATIRPGYTPGRATNMSWEYAARYVNWLHNDKVVADWAFQTGVYDTSTFTQNPDGTWNHQATHSPDARFWIPTNDEWIKAGYWDPNKYGHKQGGYWHFQNGSNVEPIPGLLPEDGGERNAGSSELGFPLDVGSFPEVTSLWGLLDMAGGEREFFETVISTGDPHQRYSGGTGYFEDQYGDVFSPDLIGQYGAVTVSFSAGLRLASIVPAPAVTVVMLIGVIYSGKRKR